MRVLVVCLLAVLGCSVAEGAIVPKCELKQKLTDKFRVQAKKEGVEFDDTVVAKIVCHVEYASGFNTSAVNELTVAKEHNNRRKREDSGVFGLAKYEDTETVWTLYGLFQLSNHLICNDGTTETHNICDMDCDKLIDDNIEDDLDCVLTLFKIFVIKLIFQDDCIYVIPSEYFKECV
ncbi:Sperm acrosome-associated protein 5 [Nibea albiflora]|uniref:Sperm acrosome-associated protein 5 n=1 Tax=Nibea albiflora TaxID=240163 RepID=A0ACB7FJS6_NIBAL|nr:Sperm acrosome-associated protein 5 [Nibea albiflora]